jgi:hypothetical protein
VAELAKSAIGVIDWTLCLVEVDIDGCLIDWAVFSHFVSLVQEGSACWVAALLALENFSEEIYFFISLFLFRREGELFELFTHW